MRFSWKCALIAASSLMSYVVVSGAAAAQQPLPVFQLGNPTNLEQELLSLMNRARSDPCAEGKLIVKQLGINLGVNATLFIQRLCAFPAVQPLGLNVFLDTAAKAHTNFMILNNVDRQNEDADDNGFFAENPERRAFKAGFDDADDVGEVRVVNSKTVLQIHQQAIVDIKSDERVNRARVLSAKDFLVGIGIVNNTKSQLGPLVMSELIAMDKTEPAFLVGVVFKDSIVVDDLYTAGEGIGGIVINCNNSNFIANTTLSGSFTLPVKNKTAVTVCQTTVNKTNFTKTFNFKGANLAWNLNVAAEAAPGGPVGPATAPAADDNKMMMIIGGAAGGAAVVGGAVGAFFYSKKKGLKTPVPI